MERGLQGELVVVQALSIERDFGPAGTTAEEIDDAAFAHHVDGPLPGLRAAHGLDDYVAATTVGGQLANGLHRIAHLGDLHSMIGPGVQRGSYLRVTLDHGDDVAAG